MTILYYENYNLGPHLSQCILHSLYNIRPVHCHQATISSYMESPPGQQRRPPAPALPHKLNRHMLYFVRYKRRHDGARNQYFPSTILPPHFNYASKHIIYLTIKSFNFNEAYKSSVPQ